MEIGPQILVYTAWLVVAIAGGGLIKHLLAQRDLRRDRAVVTKAGAKVARQGDSLLRAYRERFNDRPPMGSDEFKKQQSTGVRVALYLVIPVALLGGHFLGRGGWELVVFLVALLYVPAFTVPGSLVHTQILWLLGARGPVASIGTGVFLGAVAPAIMSHPEIIKVTAGYGAVYGLIIGLGNTAIAAPGLIPDNRPRTLEEQAKADGLL